MKNKHIFNEFLKTEYRLVCEYKMGPLRPQILEVHTSLQDFPLRNV